MHHMCSSTSINNKLNVVYIVNNRDGIPWGELDYGNTTTAMTTLFNFLRLILMYKYSV